MDLKLFLHMVSSLPGYPSSNISLMFNLILFRFLSFPILDQISSLQSSVNYFLCKCVLLALAVILLAYYCHSSLCSLLQAVYRAHRLWPVTHLSILVPFFPHLMLSLSPLLAENHLSLRNRTLGAPGSLVWWSMLPLILGSWVQATCRA